MKNQQTQSPDPHSQYVTHASGLKTHYIHDTFSNPWEPSEAVLLQGGFGRHAAFFHHWVPPLATKYRVIRRDLRGHGYSSAPSISSHPEAYTLPTILQDIIDTLDHLGIKKVHYFGESTSGILGEILAAKYPERLLSLTICSSPTHLPEATQQFLALGEKDWPTACRTLGARGWGQRLASKPGTMDSEDQKYRDWWLEQVSVSTGEGLGSYAEFLSTVDSRPYLGKIKDVPMLILAPTRSVATGVEEAKRVKEEVGRGCNVVEIDGRGHEIFVDEAEKCQRAFLEFIGEVDAKSQGR